MRPDDQRRGARPDAGHRHLPAPHAELQGRRRDPRSSRGARGPFRWSRTWSSTAARSTGSSPPAASSARRPAAPPDGNAIPIPKDDADTAMDAAQCIGCGACVAACPNGSASLFTAAKITHLGLLPQGQPERCTGARRMVEQMDLEGFGGCTLYGECQEACPKLISIDTITRMNRDYLRAARHAGPRRRRRLGLTPWPGRAGAGRSGAAAPLTARAQSDPGSGSARRPSSPWSTPTRCPAAGPDRVPAWCSPRSTSTPARWAVSGSPGCSTSRARRSPTGELAPGDWGEGFVDRRHPHTYLHELVLSADDLLGAADGAAGCRSAPGRASRRSARTIPWFGPSSAIR